jgi:hypothetical protein
LDCVSVLLPLYDCLCVTTYVRYCLCVLLPLYDCLCVTAYVC